MKLMVQKNHKIKGANVLILGIIFKENCPDARNTIVVDVYKKLCESGIKVDIYDPLANPDEVKVEYGIELINKIDLEKSYSAIIHTVKHNHFKTFDFEKYYKQGTVIFDTKVTIDRRWVDGRL